jgi:isopentenyl-diphosphate delta-isomerase
MTTNLLDQVVLVDETDHPIGTMDKVAAHRGQAKLHRAISVYVFNDQGEVLIQQRSAEKIVGAGQWANTCCGNVRPGESYLECAQRRLKEELGFGGIELKPVYKFIYHVQCNTEFSEREMDQVYVGMYNGQPKINAHEVMSTQWVTWSELLQQVERGAGEFAPWFKLMLNDEVLVASIKEGKEYVKRTR